jgi:plasmid stabilization system protein ParE
VATYELIPSAKRDLRILQDYFLREGGLRSARRLTTEIVTALRLLAKNPEIGHIREDLAGDLDLRFLPVRDILIVYPPRFRPLTIVMIVRGHRDVAALLRARYS